MQNEIWGVAAIGGIIAAAWNYLKSFTRHLSHIAFETVIIDGVYVSALAKYLLTHAKTSPFAPKYYHSEQVYLSREDGIGGVTVAGMYNLPILKSRLGWLGWRAMYIDVSVMDQISLTWPRKMFTIAEIEARVHDMIAGQPYVNSEILTPLPLPTPQRNELQVVQGRDPANIVSAGNSPSRSYETSGDITARPTASSGRVTCVPCISREELKIIGDKRINARRTEKRNDVFSDLPLSLEELDALHIVRQWYSYKHWYLKYNLSHRLGLLFRGMPGTGKSTFAHLLAYDLGAKFTRFDLATMSNRDFTEAWPTNSYGISIVLFEDFDNVFDGRNNISKQSHNRDLLTFDTILNTITAPNHGSVLLIVTTNNVEAIDAAIGRPLDHNPRRTTRPGRIDYAFEFKPPDAEARRFLVDRMLTGLDHDADAIVAETEGFTGAAVTERCRELALNALEKMQSERSIITAQEHRDAVSRAFAEIEAQFNDSSDADRAADRW